MATKRTASAEVDAGKVDAAGSILGTRIIADTVDAALDVVIEVDRRRRLVELLFGDGGLDLDGDVMGGARR